MSVRRLADPQFQPAGFAFSEANAAWADETIGKYPEGRQASAVIPLLMRAQEQDGWVTKAAIERVAAMLGMPLIRVLEVATFYTQFQLKPVGTKAHVQVCGTTPCMLRGSEALMDVCRSKIHEEQFRTNADGTLSWEEVECQGACVNAPMVMIFKDAYEDLTPERLSEIIDAFEAGEGGSVPAGPQIERIYSAPETGLTSLKEEEPLLKENRPNVHRDGGSEAEVAPSQAGKPKTSAPETDPTIKSPSPVKSDPAKEQAASVEAPQEDEAKAELSDPDVEGEAKTRHHAEHKDGTAADHHAPEDMEGGPIGAAGRRRKGETAAKVGKPSPEGGREKAGSNARRREDDIVENAQPKAVERPAEPDDLKLIAGIGPGIEGKLNGIGIYTYAQIAGWSAGEQAWVDDHLNFRGRIERDDWVRQAEALARGGVDEYVKVFGKTPR